MKTKRLSKEVNKMQPNDIINDTDLTEEEQEELLKVILEFEEELGE